MATLVIFFSSLFFLFYTPSVRVDRLVISPRTLFHFSFFSTRLRIDHERRLFLPLSDSTDRYAAWWLLSFVGLP